MAHGFRVVCEKCGSEEYGILVRKVVEGMENSDTSHLHVDSKEYVNVEVTCDECGQVEDI